MQLKFSKVKPHDYLWNHAATSELEEHNQIHGTNINSQSVALKTSASDGTTDASVASKRKSIIKVSAQYPVLKTQFNFVVNSLLCQINSVCVRSKFHLSPRHLFLECASSFAVGTLLPNFLLPIPGHCILLLQILSFWTTSLTLVFCVLSQLCKSLFFCRLWGAPADVMFVNKPSVLASS